MAETNKTKETQLSPEQLLQAGNVFLQHFGVEISPTEQPEIFLEAMAQLDPRYQGGRELVRWQLEADQTEFDEETRRVIIDTAEAMRMLEPETPLVGHFNAVIVLGGARQANLDRLRYAAEAIKDGRASTEHLIIIGSRRKLNDAERENAANYAPDAETEYGLCIGAAKTIGAEYPEIPVIHVLYEDNERAGTPVVIEKALSTLQEDGSLVDGARISAVTTQIYQASTELDLARVAKKFDVVDTYTAGNPSDPNVIAKRTVATYLSEILRTLKAATIAAQANK